MNERLLKLVHRAIRGERTALRALIERYQGFAYAYSFLAVKSFPKAQRVAQQAWKDLAKQLPSLSEPERFPELLQGAVVRASQSFPAEPPSEQEDATRHSILKTEKVQARRSLRQALATCPLPEAPVFFMRFVEGLTLEEIGTLYGLELQSVLESFRLVCVDLAFRSGFNGSKKSMPSLETLSEERRRALGYAAVITEGSLPEEECTQIEQAINTNQECKSDNEAVGMVLALADGTFSAHRLPQEFIREVLMDIPYAEPAKILRSSTSTTHRPASPKQKELPANSGITLSLASALASLIFMLWIMDVLISPYLTSTYRSTPGSAVTPFWILAIGGGLLGLYIARPPVLSRNPRLPMWYHILYGLALGGVGGLAYLSLPLAASIGTKMFIRDCLAPVWILFMFIVIGLRVRLTFQDLEGRFENRLRRLEDSVPIHFSDTPTPSAPPQGDTKAKG